MESPSKRASLSAGLSGVAGEYFVAAELSRRGYIAALTLKNSRGIDIIASKQAKGRRQGDCGDARSITIQVKTSQGPGGTWLLGKGDETALGPDHYYVFVALNGMKAPKYHIVPCARVAKYCAEYHRDWLKGTKKNGQARKDTDMREFRPFDEFLEKWEYLDITVNG